VTAEAIQHFLRQIKDFGPVFWKLWHCSILSRVKLKINACYLDESKPLLSIIDRIAQVNKGKTFKSLGLIKKAIGLQELRAGFCQKQAGFSKKPLDDRQT
jgi:hypothetical protein